MVHEKCRGEYYSYKAPDGQLHKVKRLHVPKEKVPWTVSWPEYQPPEFTADFVKEAVWADPDMEDKEFVPKWNTIDGNVNRISHEGEYLIDMENRPLNIHGRTGMRGRGVLGKWGPNHAADPIVTRWKRLETGDKMIHEETGKPVLEFVCIQRKDTGVWAIPGGMVDPGEKVSATVKREFMEEALDSTGAGKDNLNEIQNMVNDFFDSGDEIYRGYVDDPRNTDNSWMETVVIHYHDDTGDKVGKFNLRAGDDAAAICWMSLNAGVKLYASHSDFVKTVVQKMNAHW